jgi:hypothetical protein
MDLQHGVSDGIAVEYTLDGKEMNAYDERFTPERKRPKALTIACLIYSVPAMLHAAAHPSRQAWLIVALMLAALAACAVLWYQDAHPADQHVRLSASAAGLTFSVNGRPGELRWCDVSRVRDAGKFFIVRYGIRGRLVVLKAALPDHGAAFWALCRRQLVGTAMLVNPSVTTLITNTAR